MSNKSGVTGVKWDENKLSWYAYVCYNKKTLHLGFFDTVEDASVARKNAENKYWIKK